ncbi:MAG: asparagine--tRNA ligase [Candidatus Magasanikbacteria bacterium RIFCSPHIGHO2_01_FULL_33_34]|uniref:Asparagine--tRNA ligase n=1 Tax=Candidatus Magasanikbacteria bacterium RIFCSPHIGHO2_01_FULL_33_34 TaxID=1798671 RepID=A0A1F6LLA6_9BACT|nr:MAG: asparagine--tRNA ligase [Candidatus Magasanikbacteria bacterium RIFCSPHIGHO2_01_FULL_33_34]OGH65977.1 MAG: asparagine--tRNA ligase [Candidatus Magasanikbacteria bacterium RIFCSPHIGHO2_02_FULL_33_17]OGH76372.1 MAG: asparagine--tRNA ligase [Candidatus Magasanikbacteria bacterium RIFCSPLOWO2_01_FULL_33_34]OGH81478.1 MAG: asparagine--tRNA ligase [Candidatus Magasanikbacteria bacterium RIFCSPLOWO2_12_FULL_34_7]
MLIKNISQYVNQEVEIKGWLYNKRSSGSIAFLELRDGSGFVQAVVVKSGVSEEVWNNVEKLTQESSLVVVGSISKHPKQEGVFELQVSKVEIVQIAEEYPITKKEHGPDFLLDNRHLWLRSKKQWAIQRVRDEVIQAIYDYFHEQDFVKIDTPIITPNACEGSTTLFGIEYFDEGEVFLSQSGQLYLEAAIMSVGRGFDFGPTFRAEKSKTKRHLTEFWMMDAEAAYVEHDENMDIQEAMVKFIARRCLENVKEELVILERDIAPIERMLTLPFARLTYKEAIEKLNHLGSDIKFGEDLGNDDEGMLTQDSPVPVFIHKWPKTIKPFYMKVDPTDPEIVLNNDLIGIEGAGELIGGSQREDDYEVLKAEIQKEGLSGPEYQWYLDLRKYGSVPHSGFGLGLERMVGWICGVHHIRETIPFPRMINRVRP